jgi:hypothetical protein
MPALAVTICSKQDQDAGHLVSGFEPWVGNRVTCREVVHDFVLARSLGRNLDVALQNIINNGHLVHAPLVWKPIKVKKQDREMSDAEIATWRSRAESARVETPSGLVLQGKTAEVQKIVVTADGKTDWKATALAREIAAARMMGRIAAIRLQLNFPNQTNSW